MHHHHHFVFKYLRFDFRSTYGLGFGLRQLEAATGSVYLPSPFHFACSAMIYFQRFVADIRNTNVNTLRLFIVCCVLTLMSNRMWSKWRPVDGGCCSRRGIRLVPQQRTLVSECERVSACERLNPMNDVRGAELW